MYNSGKQKLEIFASAPLMISVRVLLFSVHRDVDDDLQLCLLIEEAVEVAAE
jgi:hypothetical protein